MLKVARPADLMVNAQAILYRLTFKNGKVYIGISRDGLARRVKRHITYARAGKPYALSCAIRKHGEDAFLAEVLLHGTWDEMKSAEITAIASYGSMVPHGYNMTAGGEGSLGVVLSDETKAKISATLSGATREFSESHRARLSEVQKGKVIPQHVREKMSRAAIARSRAPMAEAEREKRRKALVGRKRDPELMARIWASRKAKAAASID